jgi:hypothetical protein
MGVWFTKNQNMEDSKKPHFHPKILWISYPKSIHSVGHAWEGWQAAGLGGGDANQSIYGERLGLSTLSTAPTNITNP